MKPVQTINNFDGMTCPESGKELSKLEWAELTYSPYIKKMQSWSHADTQRIINGFRNTDWFQLSVFQWHKMMKQCKGAFHSVMRSRAYPLGLPDNENMIVVRADESMRPKLKLVDSIRAMSRIRNGVQVKITRRGVQLIGHSPVSRALVLDFIHNAGWETQQDGTVRQSVKAMLSRDYDSIKHGLLSSMYESGMTPCMIESEYNAMQNRINWVNRQLTPIERFVAVAEKRDNELSQFDQHAVTGWEKLFDNAGLKSNHYEEYKQWDHRAKKIKLDTAKDINGKNITAKFQYEDIIRQSMKQCVINASQMGLGKTREMLFTAVLKGVEKVLIICPSKLIGTWQDEIENTIAPWMRQVKYNWNGKRFAAPQVNIIRHACDLLKDSLMMFNIISIDTLKSVPKDVSFFTCPQCGLTVMSAYADEMMCPGDPQDRHEDPYQDTSCVGGLRRWKAEMKKRDENGKLVYQKKKVHKINGRTVHWNPEHKTRRYVSEDECTIVDNRSDNPYADALTGGKPRPVRMIKQDNMFDKVQKRVVGYDQVTIDGQVAKIPRIKRVKRGFHVKWTFAELVRWRFNTIIVDEIHLSMNPQSMRSRAMNHVTGCTRLAATGTPMKGMPQKIVHYINWAIPKIALPDYRTESGGMQRFLQKYKSVVYRGGTELEDGTIVGGNAVQIPKIRNPELFMSEFAPFMLRRVRTEPEVAACLPPVKCSYYDHIVPMDRNHRQYYEKWIELFIEWWEKMKEEEEGQKKKANVLPKISYLIGASFCPHFMRNAMKDSTDDDIKQWRKIIPPYTGPNVAKMLSAMEIAKSAIDKGDKVIVFAGRTKSLELGHKASLAKKWNSMVVHGGMSNQVKKGHSRSERHELIAQFREQNYNILWAGIGALAEGMNIPEANHGIILDPGWEPSKAMQAAFRMVRPQQTKEVNIHFMMHEGAIDEYMTALCYLKARSHDEGIDGVAFSDLDSEMIPDFRQYADAIVDGTEDVLRRAMWMKVEGIRKDWESEAQNHLIEDDDDDTDDDSDDS
jgi:superfamily II DNA or RNA helicase